MSAFKRNGLKRHCCTKAEASSRKKGARLARVYQKIKALSSTLTTTLKFWYNGRDFSSNNSRRAFTRYSAKLFHFRNMKETHSHSGLCVGITANWVGWEEKIQRFDFEVF